MRSYLTFLILNCILFASADRVEALKISAQTPSLDFRTRNSQDSHFLQKRTSPLQGRGACASKDGCSKGSTHGLQSAQRQAQHEVQQQRQDTAESIRQWGAQIVATRPPFQQSMEPYPAQSLTRSSSPVGQVGRTMHAGRPAQAPRTSSSLDKQNSPRSESSFETWLTRKTSAKSLPGPDPIDIALDEFGRIVPKKYPKSGKP